MNVIAMGTEASIRRRGLQVQLSTYGNRIGNNLKTLEEFLNDERLKGQQSSPSYEFDFTHGAIFFNSFDLARNDPSDHVQYMKLH